MIWLLWKWDWVFPPFQITRISFSTKHPMWQWRHSSIILSLLYTNYCDLSTTPFHTQIQKPFFRLGNSVTQSDIWTTIKQIKLITISFRIHLHLPTLFYFTGILGEPKNRAIRGYMTAVPGIGTAVVKTLASAEDTAVVATLATLTGIMIWVLLLSLLLSSRHLFLHGISAPLKVSWPGAPSLRCSIWWKPKHQCPSCYCF